MFALIRAFVTIEVGIALALAGFGCVTVAVVSAWAFNIAAFGYVWHCSFIFRALRRSRASSSSLVLRAISAAL
jgi:hypothetical protein